MNRQAKKKRKRTPSPHEQREQLADQGDLRGFIEHIVVSESEMVGLGAGSQLTRCLKKRARDVDGLCEDGFALAIELAVGLLSRLSCVIYSGLQHHDLGARPLRGIPKNLKPWLESAERVSRFIAEMSTARARVQHLRQIADTDDDAKKTQSNANKATRSPIQLNGHRHQNGNGTAKHNGVNRLAGLLES